MEAIRTASLALLLLFAYSVVAAQAPPVNADSLRQLIAVEKTDTVKANLLLRLVDVLRLTDSAGAMQANQQALALHTKQRYKPGIALALFSQGRIYQAYDHLDSAEALYKRGLAVIPQDTSIPATYARARLTGNLANIYGQRGMAEKELEMVLSAIPMLERVKDTLALAVATFNVGVKFYNGQQFAKAYNYLQKAVALHERRPSAQLTEAYLITTWCAMNLDSIDAMARYLNKAEQIIDRSNAGVLESYEIAWGLYYFKRKDFANAEKAYRRALEVKSTGLPLNRANALEALSEMYEAQRRYGPAKKSMEAYLSLSRSIPWQTNILFGLKSLSRLEEKDGRHAAALHYLREYVQLNDSIREDEGKVRLHELEMKYQAAEKEKKILTLENGNKQQQLDLQRSRTYNALLLAGLLVAALAALLVYIIYRHKHRLAAQQEQLQRQELENIKQAQRLQNYAAMVEGQEQERQRLARDLHDGLGGTMASIRLKAADLADSSSPNTALQQIVTRLDGAAQELRRIAHNLMPEILLRSGLEAALKDLCEHMGKDGVHIVCQAYDLQSNIPQPQQIMIYRLVQELVGNALRHSGAKNILVQCLQREQEIFLTVEDDGSGFNISATPAGNGMGLQSVRARVDYLKGRLDIQSAPGAGTTVNIEFDVQQTNAHIAADY